MVTGNTKSCGNCRCLIKPGMKFGLLTIISFSHKNSEHKYWNCICDCGNTKIVKQKFLVSGTTKSCGCLANSNGKKHGMYGSRIYRIYRGMWSRCHYTDKEEYKCYGGRGIQVCEEWLDKKDGFTNFYNWSMENGYSDTLSIDRIDVNGNYCPENCRWVDTKTQSTNKTTTKYITFNNQTKALCEWAKLSGNSRTVISTRLKRGWSVEDAIFYPADSKAPLKNRKQKEA